MGANPVKFPTPDLVMFFYFTIHLLNSVYNEAETIIISEPKSMENNTLRNKRKGTTRGI